MRCNKLHTDQTKHDRQRPTALARGGSTKMFPEQSAGRAKAGITGKNQTPAPGAKAAKGGRLKSEPRAARPARPGTTAVDR